MSEPYYTQDECRRWVWAHKHTAQRIQRLEQGMDAALEVLRGDGNGRSVRDILIDARGDVDG